SHLSLFFRATASSDLYTLSLHDALPILLLQMVVPHCAVVTEFSPPCPSLTLLGLFGSTTQFAPSTKNLYWIVVPLGTSMEVRHRSEEHTSELQSLTNLVCRLLLEKKKLI